MGKLTLLPGDCIAYFADGDEPFSSRMVGAVQLLCGIGKSKFQISHIAAWLCPGWQVEAKSPRLGAFPIDESRDYEIWRLQGFSPDVGRGIIDWYAARINRGDTYGWVSFLTGGLIQPKGQEVCSHAYGLAASSSGLVIPKPKWPKIWTPAAIADYPHETIFSHKGAK